MYFTAIISAAFAATALAAPASEASQAKLYYSLKTNSTNSFFSDKCLVGYHTGAGLAAATLTKCAPETSTFFTNGTSIQSKQFGETPSGLQVSEETSDYQDWLPVTINAGYGTKNLKFNGFGDLLQSDGAGFIACRWSLGGTPQIFSVVDKTGLVGFKLPGNCAIVDITRATP